VSTTGLEPEAILFDLLMVEGSIDLDFLVRFFLDEPDGFFDGSEVVSFGKVCFLSTVVGMLIGTDPIIIWLVVWGLEAWIKLVTISVILMVGVD
jgi:hypothetical protein